ncbi:L-fuculose phosphate aldolase FucA [Mycobacterium tuberculosis variant bovis BCG]|nr:L-fuculose phosphate aldolase FucA [Mycobacterium tuberculosis variant bovis BCG]
MNFVDDPESAVLAAAKDMLRRGLVEGPPEISQPGARTATWSSRRPRSTTPRCCSTIWC